MTEQKDYLSNQLQEFQEILDQKLAIHKKGLQPQSDKDKEMLEHISFAETKINEALKFHASEYEQKMELLEQKEKASPTTFTSSKKYAEEFYQRTFKKALGLSIDLWLDYVEYHKQNAANKVISSN